MNGKRLLTISGATVLATMMCFWFGTLPHIGLHGDESWLGLKAAEYLRSGIHQPYGMHYYTGILQSLCTSGVFRFFGVGLTQLRVTGACANSLALGYLLYTLHREAKTEAALYILLFFAQSAFYLIYPKVAWEVCSFGLSFLVLFAVSLYKVSRTAELHPTRWHVALLVTSLLGTYNHVLFASVPTACFVGICLARIYARDRTQHRHTLGYLLLNLINVTTFVLFMKYASVAVWQLANELLFVLPLALIVAQLRVATRLIPALESHLDGLLEAIPAPYAAFAGLFAVGTFSLYDGVAFFQVLAQRILFLRVYSYPLAAHVEWYLLGAAVALLSYVAYHLNHDIRNPTTRPWAFVVVSYLGVFHFFVPVTSIRYYLLPAAILYIYLGLRTISQSIRVRLLVATLLVTGALLVQLTLWSLSTNRNRPVQALQFPLGNNGLETSAHFLPFDPVLAFMREQKVGRILTDQPFFIGNNVLFYQLVYPEITRLPNTGWVEYNRDFPGKGFKMGVVNPSGTVHLP